MRNLKTLIAIAMLAFGGATANAQEQCCSESEACQQAQELGYKPQPYGFIQLQGGVGTTFTDIKLMDRLTPTYSIGAGYMFTPAVGARLHVNGYESKGGFPTSGDPLTYKFNYLTTDADLMVNLTNIISKKNYHTFNLYLIGGIGLNYAWNNDEFETLTTTHSVANDISNAWGDNQPTRSSLLDHNLRVGMLADINLAKHWSLGLEVDLNSMDDRFNSKYNNSDDWMLTAQLSLTYKFGFKKAPKHAPKPVVVEPKPEPKPVVVEEKPAPVVEEKPAPVVEEKVEPLKETFFYQIRESDPEADKIITKIVNWCKKYPNEKISVDGYADKGTGTPALNKKYALDRANKVASQLEKRGVPKAQMVVNSYGDTVQPFSENDKNRCVIVVGGSK